MDDQRDYAEEAANYADMIAEHRSELRAEQARKTTDYCPACGDANVSTGLDGVLVETSPEFRRHVCNVGRVTLLNDSYTDQNWESIDHG